MTEQDSEKKELRERVEALESTVQKMMPSRRDALKMAGASALGAAAFSGTGSAQTPGGDNGQAGTIGTSGERVDMFAQDIDVSKEATVEDLTINGDVTGISPSVFLESGDSISFHQITNPPESQFVDLYNNTSTTVLGGSVVSAVHIDFEYTFGDGNTLNLRRGDGFDFGAKPTAIDSGGDSITAAILPPALDVTRVEVGGNSFSGSELGALLYTLD